MNRRVEDAGVFRGRTRQAVASRAATILLVDDHPPNLMALEAILEPLGGRLLYAGSGAQAVEIATREDLALVLLDLQMPELDGLETAALLKKTDRSRAVPLIILTADEPTRAEVARGYASGAVDFLSKPLDPDVLRSKVSVFVQLYEQRHTSSRDSLAPRSDEGSGRLSERLVAAAPASEQAATVEALVRIYAALSEDLDVVNLAQRLASEAMDLTRASGAAFHYRVAGGAARTAHVGRLHEELRELGPSSAMLRGVFEGRGVVRHDDVRSLANLAAPRTLGSVIGVPVVARTGALEGALVLVHEAAYAFDARDEELVVVTATYAAAAFENARLYEEAREARHRAELAELELRAGEARLRIALEAAGLGTWDFNPITDTLRWDARCKALAGLSADAEVTYKTFLDGVHPDDRARVGAAVERAVDPRTNHQYDVEYRTVGIEDQVERWVSARGLAIVEQGRTVRFIGAMLDVTTKKRVEQERAALLASERRARAAAETASRSKDEFLATVSHELRNPLNAILGWSRVLVEERDLDGERMRKGLDVILRNAKAQVQLVEDILEVSRIVTGKLRLSTGTVDVAAVVEAAVETVRAAAQARRVSLSSRVSASAGTIIADEDRVQQILWNLLSNAVKFTPAGGSVSVSAERLDGAVELFVEDTGEGIDPEFLPYVFDRFRQFDGSTTRRHGGLGLGLAIVRHLAELHGGVVRAESKGRGRGATFKVTLPLSPSTDLGAGEERSAAPRSLRMKLDPRKLLAGRHVLVLDDDGDMRDLIGMILEDAGATVFAASTVAMAMTALEDHTPDVAVSDLAMPGEDGYAFAQRVRTLGSQAARRVPLVAMTAYARAEDRRRVLAAGFDRHVAKPIEPDELVEALVAVITGRSEPERADAS
ncbi:MAG: response regulator [Labilithrix sp.]|nr:response regulator [Labilithrix sp.]MBX3219391.1 response regulator [Labilithrix sp.]